MRTAGKESESDVVEAKRKLLVVTDSISPPPPPEPKMAVVRRADRPAATLILDRFGGSAVEAAMAAFALGFLMGAFPKTSKKAGKGLLGGFFR